MPRGSPGAPPTWVQEGRGRERPGGVHSGPDMAWDPCGHIRNVSRLRVGTSWGGPFPVPRPWVP